MVNFPSLTPLTKISAQAVILVSILFIISPLGDVAYFTKLDKTDMVGSTFFPQMTDPDVYITGDFSLMGTAKKSVFPGAGSTTKSKKRIVQRTTAKSCEDLDDLLQQKGKIEKRCTTARIGYYGMGFAIFLYFIAHLIHIHNQSDQSRGITRALHTVFGALTFVTFILLVTAHMDAPWKNTSSGRKVDTTYQAGYWWFVVLTFYMMLDVVHHLLIYIALMDSPPGIGRFPGFWDFIRNSEKASGSMNSLY